MQNVKYKMKKTIYKIETTISIANLDIISFLYLFFLFSQFWSLFLYLAISKTFLAMLLRYNLLYISN